MKLLLFSNSTNAGEEYLSYTLPYIKEFTLGQPLKALFIPYAGVSITWDEYYNMVNEKLSTVGIELQSIHLQRDAQKAVEEAELIIVGGGNTFNLLKTLQEQNIVPILQNQI